MSFTWRSRSRTEWGWWHCGLALALMTGLLGMLAPPVAAQSVQVWSGKKGSSAAPGVITADDVDANTRALHVILKGSNAVTASGTVTSNQGSPASGANAWPITVTATGDVVVKPGDSGNN